MFANTYYNNNNLEFQRKFENASISVQADAAKKVNQMMFWQDLEEKRSLAREAERERKKSQVDEVLIDQDGRILLTTRNLRIDAKPRVFTNFSHPELAKIHRISNSAEFLYLFSADFDQGIKSSVLNPDKMGSVTYLLRKLQSIGGIIMASTKNNEKKVVEQLFTLLIKNCQNNLYVPDNHGWFIDHKGQIKFSKEDNAIWKIWLEKAK